MIVHNNSLLKQSNNICRPAEKLPTDNTSIPIITKSRTNTNNIYYINGGSRAADSTNSVNKGMQEAVSLLQTSNDTLAEVDPLLVRMRELARKAEDDSVSESDRAEMQKEVQQITQRIDDFSSKAQSQFNRLLNTTYIKTIDNLANNTANESMLFEIDLGQYDVENMVVQMGNKDRLNMLDVFKDENPGSHRVGGVYGLGFVDLTTRESASKSITILDKAIDAVSAQRAGILVNIRLLEHEINYMTTTSVNLQAAESNIRDADMAQEMANYAKYTLQQKVGTFILAHSIQRSYLVLQLLKGM
ncbi:MAG: flagellin [Candidatus Saccharibacteria bacterium]